MTTNKRLLATLGVAIGLLALGGTIAQRVHPSVAQYLALADQSAWYHAWGRSGQSILLTKAPEGQAIYIESIHLGACAEACVTATFLIDDHPMLTLHQSAEQLAVPLRLQPGQRLMVVTNQDGVGVAASGYALSR